ncbi:hypothetical protein, partial [Paraburkholderia phenazinium]|uniref:hypothetical protein n=1 Tax=Paraburkholderia phenazinium TaxID=60549 RepID=UPI001FC87A6C
MAIDALASGAIEPIHSGAIPQCAATSWGRLRGAGDGGGALGRVAVLGGPGLDLDTRAGQLVGGGIDADPERVAAAGEGQRW